MREKRIKKWNRVWKLELIEHDNLAWRDLAEDLGFPPLEPTGSPASAGMTTIRERSPPSSFPRTALPSWPRGGNPVASSTLDQPRRRSFNPPP